MSRRSRGAGNSHIAFRPICGHLTEEMTERYISVAQVEIEVALGRVASLAGKGRENPFRLSTTTPHQIRKLLQ